MENILSPKGGTETTQRASKVHDEAHSPKQEEKTTEGYYIPEAHRLIKSGYYKKAFILMEKHLLEAESIPTILKIKLVRRMMEAITKICNGSLVKGEIREDKFIKMLEKSNTYLYLWHELLSIYITKTNPKFAHLHGLLDDLSSASEEEVEAMNFSKSRMSSQYIIGSLDNLADTGEQKASMFARKLKKKKEVNPKERDSEMIDNTFNFLGGPNIKVEVFDGTEISVNFFLDEFLKYMLSVILNWSMFFKKVVKNYKSAYRFLMLGNKLSQDVETTLNPDLLNVVARVRLALGVFYSEFGKHQEAQETFESTINVLQVEISLRNNRTKDRDKGSSFMDKYRKTIRMLIMVFINISIIEEQQENYSRTLESLKLAWFFTRKFITPDDEIYKSCFTLLDMAMRKYDKYIRELGEIERIALGNDKDLAEQENRKVATKDHFTKINEHLYNKFQYDKLNANQRIILIQNSDPILTGFKTPTKKREGEESPDHTEKWSEDKSPNRMSGMKAPYGDASAIKSENDSQGGVRYSNVQQNSISRDKKRRKLRRMLNVSTEDKSYKLMSDKYTQEIDVEKEVSQIQLDPKEEEAYASMLNKNIRRSYRKLYRSPTPVDPVTNDQKSEFVDIDEYFHNMMEKKILEKDEQMKLNPVDFQRIVKNHAFFMKNEEFDKREFSFATRMVNSKAKEDLSNEITVKAKYKPRPFKIAQLNEVKLDAYYHEVKFEAEKRIMQRNAQLKNAKRPMARSVQKEDWDSLKKSEQGSSVGGAAAVGRRSSVEPSNMSTLFQANRRREDSQLTRNLGLIREVSSKSYKGYGSHRNSVELGSEGKYSSTKEMGEKVKSSIQLIMEGVEKNIEEGDTLQKRIQENKPIVDIVKPKEMFLKVPSDLAKSTYLLAERTDIAQKTWNLNEFLRGQKNSGQRIGLKEKKKPDQRSVGGVRA